MYRAAVPEAAIDKDRDPPAYPDQVAATADSWQSKVTIDPISANTPSPQLTA